MKNTFAEFCFLLKGYNFKRLNEKVPKYQLYWRGVAAKDLMTDKTIYTKTIR